MFTGSFNQVPIFKSFLFRDYLLTLIAPMLGDPALNFLLQPSIRVGMGSLLLPVPCVSRAGPFPHMLPEPS